jgi:hypothetical protein
LPRFIDSTGPSGSGLAAVAASRSSARATQAASRGAASGAEPEEKVVGAHPVVPAARPGVGSEGGPDPGGPGVQGRGGDDQVVQAGRVRSGHREIVNWLPRRVNQLPKGQHPLQLGHGVPGDSAPERREKGRVRSRRRGFAASRTEMGWPGQFFLGVTL